MNYKLAQYIGFHLPNKKNLKATYMLEVLLHAGNSTMNNKGWMDLHPLRDFSPHFKMYSNRLRHSLQLYDLGQVP